MKKIIIKIYQRRKFADMKEVKNTMETRMMVSEDGEKTFQITKNIKEWEGERAVIIMLYPTRSEKNMEADDNTTLHIVSHMRELGLSSVTIINLFSKVVNARMSSKGISIDAENIKYIGQNILRNPDYKKDKFIVAWGSAMQTSQVVTEAKKLFVSMYYKSFPEGTLYQLSAKGVRCEKDMATHPLYLGIRSKFSKWKLVEYDSSKYEENRK